jgi:hypothetical protein
MLLYLEMIVKARRGEISHGWEILSRDGACHRLHRAAWMRLVHASPRRPAMADGLSFRSSLAEGCEPGAAHRYAPNGSAPCIGARDGVGRSGDRRRSVPGPGVSGRRKNWLVLAVWVDSRHGCSAVLCYRHLPCLYQCEPLPRGEPVAVLPKAAEPSPDLHRDCASDELLT